MIPSEWFDCVIYGWTHMHKHLDTHTHICICEDPDELAIPDPLCLTILTSTFSLFLI